MSQRTRTITAWAWVGQWDGKIARYRQEYDREGKLEQPMMIDDWEKGYEQATLAIYETRKKAIKEFKKVGCMLSRWNGPYRLIHLTGPVGKLKGRGKR